MPRPSNVLDLMSSKFDYAGWEDDLGHKQYFRVRNISQAANAAGLHDKSEIADRAKQVTDFLRKETDWESQCGLPARYWDDISPSQVRRAIKQGQVQQFSKAVLSVLCLELALKEHGIDYDIYDGKFPVGITPCTYYIPQLRNPIFRSFYQEDSDRLSKMHVETGQRHISFFEDLNNAFCCSEPTANAMYDFLKQNKYNNGDIDRPRSTHPCVIQKRTSASKHEILK